MWILHFLVSSLMGADFIECKGCMVECLGVIWGLLEGEQGRDRGRDGD